MILRSVNTSTPDQVLFSLCDFTLYWLICMNKKLNEKSNNFSEDAKTNVCITSSWSSSLHQHKKSPYFFGYHLKTRLFSFLRKYNFDSTLSPIFSKVLHQNVQNLKVRKLISAAEWHTLYISTYNWCMEKSLNTTCIFEPTTLTFFWKSEGHKGVKVCEL